jgi:hypothetical protein
VPGPNLRHVRRRRARCRRRWVRGHDAASQPCSATCKRLRGATGPPEATRLATAAQGITIRCPMWGTVGSTPSSTSRRTVVVDVRSTWAASRTQRRELIHWLVRGYFRRSTLIFVCRPVSADAAM